MGKSTIPSRIGGPSGIRSKTATPNANTAAKSAASQAAAQKREAQRKQLLEMKRKHKMAMTTTNVQLPSNDDQIVTGGAEANGDANHTNETDR